MTDRKKSSELTLGLIPFVARSVTKNRDKILAQLLTAPEIKPDLRAELIAKCISNPEDALALARAYNRGHVYPKDYHRIADALPGFYSAFGAFARNVSRDELDRFLRKIIGLETHHAD